MASKKVGIKVLCGIVCVLLGLVFLAAVAWGVLSTLGFTVTVGRCLATDGGEYLLIDGESPIVLAKRNVKSKMFEDLSTGDKILVVHDNAIEESYPGQTGAFFCLRLEKGTPEDVPLSVRESLSELGWYREPEPEMPLTVNSQIVRTDGDAEGETYPQTAIIRSTAELKKYVAEKKKIWNVETEQFQNALYEYNDVYFKDKCVVMILLQEPSGSIHHEVASAEVLDGVMQVTLRRLVPEMGTDDMAAWHVILETAARFDEVQVTFEEKDSVPVEGRTVSAEYKGMSVGLTLPKNWDCKEEKYSEQTGDFGLLIYPKTHPERRVSIAFHLKGFGVCGTGLSGRRYVLAERPVYEGTYDGKPMWDYISFEETKNQLIIINDGCTLDEKQELMRILETIVVTE